MNFKNEKSKIYFGGRLVLSVLVIIISIVYFMHINIDTKWTFKLLDIQQILLGLLMILWGTEELIAKKKKFGYVFYIVGAFNFIVVIMKFVD